MKKVQDRYVLGLTATLTRKDGHHPIVMMQTGPVLFQVEPGFIVLKYRNFLQKKYGKFYKLLFEPYPGIADKGSW